MTDASRSRQAVRQGIVTTPGCRQRKLQAETDAGSTKQHNNCFEASDAIESGGNGNDGWNMLDGMLLCQPVSASCTEGCRKQCKARTTVRLQPILELVSLLLRCNCCM